MNAMILKLDLTGRPLRWVTKQEAALLYSRDLVAWEAGERCLRIMGGTSRLTLSRSYIDLSTIVAARGIDRRRDALSDVPLLTNTRLFRRDAMTCMYCGERFARSQLSRDHLFPVSKGGKDCWENVVSACRPCNHRKGDCLPDNLDRLGMRLIAIPYAPNRAEGLILANHRILGDQMAYLKTQGSKERARSN